MIRVIALVTLLVGAAVVAIAVPAARLVADDPIVDAAAADAAPLGPFAVDWKGFVRVGVADMFAHTEETELLVSPIARMGFEADVPEGTTDLEFAMKWPKGTRMHLMVHGPHEAGMPTYMAEWPDSGEDCIRVPAAEVLPGTWKVMAHSEREAVNLEFTITVRTVGPEAATVLEGLHGHPARDPMEMAMRAPEPCVG